MPAFMGGSIAPNPADVKSQKTINARMASLNRNLEQVLLSRRDATETFVRCPSTPLIQLVEEAFGVRNGLTSVQSEFAPVKMCAAGPVHGTPETTSGTVRAKVPEPSETIKVGDSWKVHISYNGDAQYAYVLVLGFRISGARAQDAIVSYYWTRLELMYNSTQRKRMRELGAHQGGQYAHTLMVQVTKSPPTGLKQFFEPSKRISRMAGCQVVVLTTKVDLLCLSSFFKKVDVVQELTFEDPAPGIHFADSMTDVLSVAAVFELST